jgi:hypothetical protein
MATIVAAAGGGNWNATGTWVGGVVPTSADDVQLNATSGNVTILTSTTALCRSLDCTGYTGTLTQAVASFLTIGDATSGLGNIALKFVAGMTYTPTACTITFSSSSATQQAITTAGKILAAVSFSSLGQNYIQTDDLTSNNNVLFGASLTYDTVTNSAKIILTGTNVTFGPGSSSRTFYEVDLTGSGAPNINGNGTFTNLKRVGTAIKTDALFISGNITVTGTLTLQGNNAINRLLVQSNTAGTQRTITCNGTIVASNVDFSDIVGAGTASWNLSAITGGSGDAGGNGGITFTSSATQTWSGTAGGNWSVNAWSGRVPLPQDDVVINAAFAASQSVVADMPRLGRSINWTGATGTPQWNLSIVLAIYGSLTLISAMTVIGGSSGLTFAARSGSWTITSAGKSFGGAVTIGAVSASIPVYTLQDAFSAAGRLTVTSKLVTQGFSLTLSASGTAALVTTLASTSVLDLGASIVTVLGSTAANVVSFQQFTVINATGSNIVISSASAALRSITPSAGNNLGALTYTVANSPGGLQLVGASSWQAINIGSGRYIVLPNGQTTTVSPGGWNVAGSPNGYQYLPGVAGNYASSPNAAPLQITGDITIEADIAPLAWASGGTTLVVAKTLTAGQYCYQLYLDSAGKVSIQTFVNGSTSLVSTSTVATGFSAGARRWVRASLQVNDGSAHNVVNFYTSTDGSTWTQLGATITNVGATSIFNGTSPLEVGSNLGGTANLLSGAVYRVRIYNANLLNGSGIPVFDANFATKPFGANSFAESSANAATVTINGPLALQGDGRVSISSASTGSQATVSVASGTVASDYLALVDNAATGGATFNAGSHSVNAGNVTGWTFGAGRKLLALLGVG